MKRFISICIVMLFWHKQLFAHAGPFDRWLDNFESRCYLFLAISFGVVLTGIIRSVKHPTKWKENVGVIAVVGFFISSYVHLDLFFGFFSPMVLICLLGCMVGIIHFIVRISKLVIYKSPIVPKQISNIAFLVISIYITCFIIMTCYQFPYFYQAIIPDLGLRTLGRDLLCN